MSINSGSIALSIFDNGEGAAKNEVDSEAVDDDADTVESEDADTVESEDDEDVNKVDSSEARTGEPVVRERIKLLSNILPARKQKTDSKIKKILRRIFFKKHDILIVLQHI